MSYPDIYYAKKENELLSQGDIFVRFEDKIIPKSEQKELGFIILTYTCDLEHLEDLNYILICPIFDFDNLIEMFIKKHEDKTLLKVQIALESIMKSLFNNDMRFYFFLSPIPEVSINPAYAHLEQITKIPTQYMEKLIENRKISLKTPWREKLGWMTGNLFNRIGTEDIDKGISKEFVQTNEIFKDFIEIRSKQIKSSLIEYFDRDDEITRLFKEKILPIFIENRKTTRDMIKAELINSFEESEIESIFEKLTHELQRSDNQFLRDMITFERMHHKLDNFRISDFFKSITKEVLNSEN